MGFSPILPFGTTFRITGTETLASGLAQITEEAWQDTAIDLLGLFVSYIAAKTLSIGFEVAGLIAIGVKRLVQWGLFAPPLMNEKAGSAKMLAAFFANMLMGFVALATSVGETFAQAVWNVCTVPMASTWMLGADDLIKYAAPLEIIRTWVDYVESLVLDFPMALFAWTRYSGWI